MATYAIGDVQGCFDELRQLLARASVAKEDRLWFVGDLVNRGPKSLEVLRFVRDLAELVGWLRRQPMVHCAGAYAMVHAGLLPQWSLGKARALGGEVSAALAASDYREFLQHMYGDKPERWDDSLSGRDRLRVIVNAMVLSQAAVAIKP